MDRIKLALWKNEKRETPSHPPLKGGKPVEIGGSQYWISAYVNGPKDNAQMEESINRMIDKLAELNGNYPIVSISLTPVQGQQGTSQSPREPGSDDEPDFNDDIPFAVILPFVGTIMGAGYVIQAMLHQV